MSEVGVEIVKTEEVQEKDIKYLNINVSNSEVERKPNVVRLCADAGILEYVEIGDILIADQCECENCIHEEMCKWKKERHGQECAYMQEPKAGHCKDCKHFEYDSVAKVDGIPLIIAHEICNRWGDGCKTREDGYCFLFEPQEGSDKE